MKTNRAGLFGQQMKRTWLFATLYAEHNAVEVAKRQGAVNVGPWTSHDHFVKVPGDMPASLWEWPDGSRYVIGDDGNWVEARSGRRVKLYLR